MGGVFRTGTGPNGEVLQAAVPTQPVSDEDDILKARGLLTRGVVLTTYVTDENQSVLGDDRPHKEIFCDVLGYSDLEGSKTFYLPRCQVSQDRAGLNDGDIWVPRASTQDISASSLDTLKNSNPMDLDGDHVLIGFLDDDLGKPIIIRSIIHPNSDVGKAVSVEIGKRMRPVVADGQPRIIKHRGVYFGVDKNGDFFIDSTAANDGVFNADGSEKDPPQDGTAGNIVIRTQTGANLKFVGPDNQFIEMQADGTVKIVGFTQSSAITLNPDGTITIDAGDDGAKLTVLGSETDLQTDTVKLGDGANQSVVLGDTWDSARGTKNTALQLVWTSLEVFVQAWQQLLTAPIPPATISAYIAVLAPFVTSLNVALAAQQPGTKIATFEGGDYLSDNVKTRD